MREQSQPCYTTVFEGFEALTIRPLALEDDLPVLHEWFSRDYARFRGMRGASIDALRRKYQEGIDSGAFDAFVGLRSSTAERLFLFERYSPQRAGLASYYDARQGDRGVHLIVAPADRPVHALTYFVLLAISEFIFSDSSVERIVAEPDLRNRKAVMRFVQSGYRLGPVVRLPDKVAQMVFLTRERCLAMSRSRAPSKPPLPFWAFKLEYHITLRRFLERLGNAIRRQA